MQYLKIKEVALKLIRSHKTTKLIIHMEEIIKNPGLQHLAEKVFWNLVVEDLRNCAQINQSCQQILQNPIFWLRKFKHLSMENKKCWIKAIQSVKNSDKVIAIISYLRWNLKKEALMDLPCYTSPAVQDDFRMRIREICEKRKSSNEDLETVKILASLIDNPNAPNKNGWTPIHYASLKGHKEIVKILAPLTDNPNVPNGSGWTPIHGATFNGHIEIVKILSPLTENPNASDGFGFTPIHHAAQNGHTEIVKILAPLKENPNALDGFGLTPIHHAASYGHTEIVKI